MAIRLRVVDGEMVALCAVETDAREGDVYLDDSVHQALADKFHHDWSGSGLIQGGQIARSAAAESQKLRDASEEHERWRASGWTPPGGGSV